MRLDHLIIPSYRNLRGFEINFDELQPTTVLLGRNGTGKSNLIEAIVQIFRDLEVGGVPMFAYRLQYVCRDRVIAVDADPERSSKRLDITVDTKPVTQADFQRNRDTYLPNFVFAYYSGWSTRLERLFNDPSRAFYRRVLNSSDGELPLRRLFFCRKEYAQLVLLAFFLIDSEAARDLLNHHLRIKQFVSALFVLKRPDWAKKKRARGAEAAGGDSRFWSARGAFRGFLARLWTRALAPIRHAESVERVVRHQGEKTERHYHFIKDHTELAGLKQRTEDAKALFGYLESLFLCDIIDEVRVTVERTDGARVKFAQLSEGEQQLLTVLGLLLFTQNDESLYLLDEPDTHLNPVWTYDYLDLLQKNLRAEKGHLIIATHNPLMIGGLHKNQVRVFAEQDGRLTASEPEYDPIGVGVEGLLKSELYGLRSTLAPEILEKLDRHYLLVGKANKTPEEEQQLMALATELNNLAIARTHPNPYFEHFASAMARQAPAPEEALSKGEIDAQAELADQVLAEVFAEEKAGRGEEPG